MPRFPGFFRWLAPFVCLLACDTMAMGQTCSSTIKGTVYSPLGPTAGDPIPNILVYAVPDKLPPFATQGVVDGGCAVQPNLVPSTLLGYATTDAAGNFSFTGQSIPSTANIVIQAGKWRRQYVGTAINQCATTTLPSLTMPADHTQGDLPHIAIVSGSSDSVECIFKKIGISTSEFTLPNGTGSINLYEGEESGGQASPDSTGSYGANPTPSETVLESSVANLDAYDLVMFGCQGYPEAPEVTTATKANLVSYANNGGRVFATHYGYVWLENNDPFDTSATWLSKESFSAASQGYVATIDQTYPEGAILAQWLQNIGASYNNTKGQIILYQTRGDTSAVHNPPAQSWLTLNNNGAYPGNPSMQFTFNTPVGSESIPTVAVSYANSTSTFQQGDLSDTVTIDVTNNGAVAADSSLTMTVALPGGLTATSFSGVGNTDWVCTPALVCTRTAPLASGASDPITLTFSIASTATVGPASITTTLSGGGLQDSSQCGRVLYNDYHVEQNSQTGTLYPLNCSPGAMTQQEKFLEFSLYNLSNFISPSTTDNITIQGPVTINWPTPAPILYGTALSSTQLDATATDETSNTTVPGAFVYTPAAGTVLATGTDALSVAFTPTDNVGYASATGSTHIEVDPDPTTTTLTGVVTPIYYGQIIAETAIEGVSSNGPANVDQGSTSLLYFEINGVIVCTVPPDVKSCPPTTGAGYDAGSYQIQSIYSGDANFITSSSPMYTVVVLPDPTTTSLTSSVTSILPSQPATFTATVADSYYSPVSGTITFYDGNSILAMFPATADSATYTASYLNIGTHSIKACFASAINASNTTNFVNSCSAVAQVIVALPPSVDPTVTILTSSLNPSIVGEAVTFSATTATTGAFITAPTGSVSFYDGTTSLGSNILSDGSTSITTSTLAAGLHNITAAYSGNTTMSPSTSAIVAQQVNLSLASAGSGFLLSVTPTTFSAGAGSATSVAVTILELNNFNQPVKLSCSGLPAESTCTFALSTMPESGGSTPLTLSITAPHNCGSNTPYFIASGTNTGLPIMAAAVLVFFVRRRRTLKGLALAVAICIIPAISGCGGTCTDLGVRPGTYTFTVTGTSTGNPTVTKSQTMTMTVTI